MGADENQSKTKEYLHQLEEIIDEYFKNRDKSEKCKIKVQPYLPQPPPTDQKKFWEMVDTLRKQELPLTEATAKKPTTRKKK